MLRSAKTGSLGLLLRVGGQSVAEFQLKLISAFSRRRAVYDLREGGDAVTALKQGRKVLLDLPLSSGIGLHRFNLGAGEHPFVVAVKAAIGSGSKNEDEQFSIIFESLASYYATVQPKTVNDWLDLHGANAVEKFSRLPPAAVVFPWQKVSPLKVMEYRRKGVANENRLAGLDVGFDEGWHPCGPVSHNKLLVETTRLVKVMRSISASGFKRHDGHDGDVEAVLLTWGQDSRWWINHGHHRAAVSAALGFRSIPVRLTACFDVSEFAAFPSVSSGLYSERQAHMIMRRLFWNS